MDACQNENDYGILVPMRDYELTLILKPDLTDETREKVLGEIKKLIEDASGKIVSQDLWGKKAFAYPIKKEREGVYAFFVLSLVAKEIASLEKKIKIKEGVLRHLLVKKD